MSEKNTAPKEAKDATKEKKPGDTKAKEKGDVVRVEKKKEAAKVAWTLSRCMKYARRYPNEVVWASASPSSYKSAIAHGWHAQCLVEIEKAHGGKVLEVPFTKKTDSKPTDKKAA